MNKHLRYPVFLLLYLVSQQFFAQDPGFTQFYASPMYLNPAFAGTARCPRFVLNHRNQWPAISGTFVSSIASYDQHVEAVSGGLGLLITHDQADLATLTTTSISGIYAYHHAITPRFSIRVGFQGTYCSLQASGHHPDIDTRHQNFR